MALTGNNAFDAGPRLTFLQKKSADWISEQKDDSKEDNNKRFSFSTKIIKSVISKKNDKRWAINLSSSRYSRENPLKKPCQI